jgi:hypothetical protein
VDAGTGGTLTLGNDGSQEAGVLHSVRNHAGHSKIELVEREFNPGNSIIAANDLIRNLTIILCILPNGPPAVQGFVVGIFQEQSFRAPSNTGNAVQKMGDDWAPAVEVLNRVFSFTAESANGEVRKGVDSLTGSDPFFKIGTERSASGLNANPFDRSAAEKKCRRETNLIHEGDTMVARSMRGVNTKGGEGRFLIPGVVTIAGKPSKVRKVPAKGLAKGAGSSRQFGKPKLDSTASVIIATVEPEFQNGVSHKGFGG